MLARVYCMLVIQMYLPRSPAEPDMAGGSAFEVALVYEDAEAGKRGKCFCDMLSAAIRPGVDTHYKLCNFQMLKTREGRIATAECAAKADLVVLSTSSGRMLPKGVKEWLEMWTGLLDTAGPALAAVFTKKNRATRVTCDYLSGLAATGSIEFFPYTVPGERKGKRISNKGTKGIEKTDAVRGTRPRARAGISGGITHDYVQIV
jgi:hypothetical protein